MNNIFRTLTSVVIIIIFIGISFVIYQNFFSSNNDVSLNKASVSLNDNNDTKNKNVTKTNLNSENESNLGSSNNYYQPIIIISLITTFLSVSLSIYLYYWRSIIIANRKYLVPEKLAKEMSKMSIFLSKLGELNQEVLKDSHGNIKNIKEEITKQNTNFLKLQENLDNRDSMIQRYQEGYESKIFKNFLNRFFRIYRFVYETSQNSNQEKEIFSKLILLFEDAFEECDVEIFYPKIGIDYIDDGNELEDKPKILFSDIESQNNKVVEVISPGLRWINSDIKNRIIIKSRVAINKFKE